MNYLFFDRTRSSLKKLTLPKGDIDPDLPAASRFSDGASYRLEVPTVNSADALEALLENLDKHGVTVNRITETMGIFRHTREEIRRYVALCSTYGCQLIMSHGPRATYDTGGSVKSPQGRMVGYRLRGQEQIVRALEDIRRALDLGVRGFVIYDEGLLWVLGQLRQEGDLPADVHFKVSAHCGHGNPASARLLESIGANSFNPTRDLHLQMLCAIRAAVSIPIDCHTDTPAASGGFIRFYEVPAFAQYLAPVYLKTGNSVLCEHGATMNAKEAVNVARQVIIVKEVFSLSS